MLTEAERLTCGDCRHAHYECCDFGICELKFNELKPRRSLESILDAMDEARVDMQEDRCGRIEVLSWI